MYSVKSLNDVTNKVILMMHFIPGMASKPFEMSSGKVRIWSRNNYEGLHGLTEHIASSQLNIVINM